MSTRAAPPIIPAFGDENQHYTMFFGNMDSQKNIESQIKGGHGRPEEDFKKSRETKTSSVKKISRNTTNDSSIKPNLKDSLATRKKVPIGAQESLHESHIGSAPKLATSPYQGRLGNKPNANPRRPLGNTAQPHRRDGIARTLPNEQFAKGLEFQSWESDPNVDITGAFEARVQNKRGNSSTPQEVPTTSTQTRKSKVESKSSWWRRCINIRKWWRRASGHKS